jgi:hypothetical protein
MPKHSPAELMYRKARNQGQPEMANSDSLPTDTVSIENSPVHQRLFYVVDQLYETIPAEMRDHPMAKLLSVFIREGRKDLIRVPGDFVKGLSKQVGEAFMWVSDGDMADLESENGT